MFDINFVIIVLQVRSMKIGFNETHFVPVLLPTFKVENSTAVLLKLAVLRLKSIKQYKHLQ